MTRKGLVAILMAIVVFFAFNISGCSQNKVEEYEKNEMSAKVIKIIGEETPHVRSEPKRVPGYTGQEEINSLGKVEKTGFTMEVSLVYSTDEHLDDNGNYVGLRVDDILVTPEGLAWFPAEINDDEDGIVWINHAYIQIIV